MTNSSLAKIVVIMGLISLLYGFGVGGFILREPDTCFLLSLGRWICEHKALPITDPFSFTFSLYPQPLGLVVYQWLTEVIFFSIYKLAGTLGLELFGCSILVTSFFIIPWHILNSFSIGPVRAGFIIVWLALGTIDRILLKPEIFSYFFLSLFILIIVRKELHPLQLPAESKKIFTLGALMTLWANLHTGFVIGIVLTLLLAIRDFIVFIIHKIKKVNIDRIYSYTWLLSFLICLIASFITPYGITLWQYIPHLYFHPINRYIIELKPLSFTMVVHNFPLLISFFGLSALATLQAIRRLKTPLNKSDVFYILIAFVSIILGISCMRMVTFALLLILPLIASGFNIKNTASPLTHRINVPAIVLCFALSGCLIVRLLNDPTIPISTAVFKPPFAALKYISEHPIAGNLLNDPTFGDVVIWNMNPAPKVFIDTRFDAYPSKITEDYLALRDCKPGWQKLLEQYHIDWILLPSSTKLCAELSKIARWQIAYKDDIAEILVHH